MTTPPFADLPVASAGTRLEAALASRLASEHVVAVSSGTAALHAALHVSGLGPADDVLVPALSPVCVVMPIIATGAKVVVCDVNDTFNPAVEHLLAAGTNRTRAVLVVHRFGHWAPVQAYADALPAAVLVEDYAQGFAARRHGQAPPQVAPFAAYSFGSTKALAVGAGGALAVPDDLSEARVRRFVGLGTDPDGEYRGFGLNYEIPEIVADAALRALELLDGLEKVRRELAAVVRAELCTDLFRPVWSPPPGVDACQQTLVFQTSLPTESAARALRGHGLDCNIPRPRTLYTEPAVVAAMRDPSLENLARVEAASNAARLLRSTVMVRLTEAITRVAWDRVRADLWALR